MTRMHAMLAMIATAVLAAGLIIAVTMTGAAQAASTTLVYSCQFQSGTAQATVRVTASLPATASAGKPIQPAGATITVTLPPSVASGLARARAATVTGTVRLDMAVTGGASTSDSEWTGLAVPATTVLAAGNLVLTASGSVPAVTAARPGTVVFTPGTLDLALTPHTTAGAAPGVTAVEADCKPGTGQKVALASTTISGRPAVKSAQSSSAVTPYSVCSQIPQGPQGTASVSGPFPGNEYIDGYTDAAKMDGSALVGPAYVSGSVWDEGGIQVGDVQYAICSVAEVQPAFDGTPSLPPFTATFAAFGFVPVTATVQLTEVGVKNAPPITNVSYQEVDQTRTYPDQPYQTPFTSITTARLLLRVLSAKVNGVPLDIGAHCQTATPLFTAGSPEDPDPSTDPLVVLSGSDGANAVQPVVQSPVLGGANTGDATIPPFTGCGTSSDNLDPLFDASVSGPGNHVDMVTGLLCEHGYDAFFCALPSKTQADTEPLWSVTNGGAFSATGQASLQFSPPLGTAYSTTPVISCTSSTVRGFLPDTSGPLRGALGTLSMSMSGCTNTGTGSSWTITEKGTASLAPTCSMKTCGTTTAQGTVSGMTLTASDGTCTVTAGSPIAAVTFYYTNPPAPTFALGNYVTLTSVSSGCLSQNELGSSILAGQSVTVSLNPSPVTPGTIQITSPIP